MRAEGSTSGCKTRLRTSVSFLEERVVCERNLCEILLVFRPDMGRQMGATCGKYSSAMLWVCDQEHG